MECSHLGLCNEEGGQERYAAGFSMPGYVKGGGGAVREAEGEVQRPLVEEEGRVPAHQPPLPPLVLRHARATREPQSAAV